MDLSNLQLKESLGKVKFELRNKELVWEEYESISAQMFFSPQTVDKKNRIIIHPGGELMLIISIIMSAFNDYIRNMIDPANNILEHLEIGDMVEVNGYRAIYEGIKDNNIILKYVDGSVYFPVDHSYKMTGYNGCAKTINKMPTKKGVKRKVTKDVVSSIFNIDTKEFSNIIKYSTIIVAQKEKVYEIVNNLKIVYEGKKYDITSIFPFAYYSSADRQLDFAGNATKVEPIIKFTSKISVAQDIIQNNKDIKNVTIIGEEIFRNNPTYLDWIIKRRSIENTNIVFEWSKMRNIEGLLENIENIEIYAWSKNAILDKINLYHTKSYDKKISSCSCIQHKVIYNFVNKVIDIKKLNNTENLDNKILVTRKLLKEISYNMVIDDKRDEFLKLSYTLINLYEKSCFPLKVLEEMIEEERLIAVHPKQFIERLNELAKYLELYVFDSASISKGKYIIENLTFIRKVLYENNPKWYELIKAIRMAKFNKMILVVYKAYFIDVIRKCLEMNKMTLSFEISTINRFNPNKMYDVIVIAGVYQGKNYDIINSSYNEKVIILPYLSESKLFAWINKKNSCLVNKIEKVNKLVEYDSQEVIDEINDMNIELEEEVKDLIDIEDIINDIIKKHGIIEGNFNTSVSRTDCVRVAIFESGEKAYFSKYFSPSLLDRSSEDIRDVNTEELSVGDELVFKKDEKDMDKDIIQDVIEKLLENSEFKKEYENKLMLSRYWKNALDNFMNENNYNENYISSQLLNYNVIRSPMAINTWLRFSKSTAPDKQEVYYALANIIKDKFFMDKWKDIYEACSAIRKLNIRLKKYLGKCIVKSVVKEVKSDFDKIVEACVGDITKFAQIVQIEQLYDVQIEVPVYMINKLIEI